MNGKERQHKESPIPRFIYHLQLLHSISLFFLLQQRSLQAPREELWKNKTKVRKKAEALEIREEADREESG